MPSRTACDLLPETVARLAEIPNIIGIKEATGDISRVEQINTLCNTKLELYTGEDANAVDFIVAGGQGVISVTANVAPAAMHEMCAAALDDNIVRARQINNDLALLHQSLFVEANPIPVKWALTVMGKIPAGIRLPMTVLSDRYHQPVRDALVAAKVLN